MNVFYVVFTGFVLYFAVLYKSTGLCALFLLLVLLLIPGLWQVFAAAKKLRLSLPEQSVNPPGKRTSSLVIQAENKGRLPIPGVSLRLSLFSPDGTRLFTKQVRFSHLKNTGKTAVSIHSSLCGFFLCRIDSVRVYGWFSVFCQKRKEPHSVSLIFYPELSPLPVRVSEYTRYFPAESEPFDFILPGTLSSPAPQVREFRQGDSLRQIHWKLTAKTGELFVRDHGKPDGCPVLLFLAPLLLKGKDAPARYSCFFECAASLSFALLEARCRHCVIWYNRQKEELERFPVTNEDSFHLFVYALLHALPYDKELGLTELYVRQYPSDTWCTTLLLNSRLEFSKNQEAPIFLKESQWKQQLSSYTLVV